MSILMKCKLRSLTSGVDGGWSGFSAKLIQFTGREPSATPSTLLELPFAFSGQTAEGPA